MLCYARGCMKLLALTGSSGRLAEAPRAGGQPEGPSSAGSALKMASMASICCVSCPGAACWRAQSAVWLDNTAWHSSNPQHKRSVEQCVLRFLSAAKHAQQHRAHLRAGSALCVCAVGKVHGFLLPAEALEHMRGPVLSCTCHSTPRSKLKVSLELSAYAPPRMSGAHVQSS